MIQLSYVLLVCTSLFSLVLGAALPSLQSIKRQESNCEPGSQKCHEYVLSICSGLGIWVEVGPCQLPTLCEEGASTGDTRCVRSDINAEIDADDGLKSDTLAAMSSPGTTRAPSGLTPCEEDEVRCNGNMQEMCDCVSRKADRLTVLPMVPRRPSITIATQATYDAMVTRSKSATIAATGVISSRAAGPLAQLPVQPSIESPTGPPVSPSCVGGEVECDGDRIKGCTASGEWEDFGPCPNCKQLSNTRADCIFLDAGADVSSIVGPFPVLAHDESTSLSGTDDPPVPSVAERCEGDLEAAVYKKSTVI
ncbi:hypothetical protein K449DRAFT_399611 [Hypoxylon sp. EC38]|nr:hypothetical protein K449DRAFT_399611 [Hypoxylon sp. EC38]